MSSPHKNMVLRRPQILAVEDSKADLFLIRRAIQSAGVDAELHIVADGEAATRFFDAVDNDESTAHPDLVILDLNLPKKNGHEVLTDLRKSSRCRSAAVVIVTSSDSAEDREAAAALAVAKYFRKPSEFREFMKLGEIIKELLEARTS